MTANLTGIQYYSYLKSKIYIIVDCIRLKINGYDENKFKGVRNKHRNVNS